MTTKRVDKDTTTNTVSSKVYHHRVEPSLPGAKAWWSDNFFDLLSDQVHTVEIRHATATKLKVRSLVDTAGR